MNQINRFGTSDKFLLFFDYDPELIEDIKATLRGRFNPKLKRWSVMVSSPTAAKKLLDFADLNLFQIERKDKRYLEALASKRGDAPSSQQD